MDGTEKKTKKDVKTESQPKIRARRLSSRDVQAVVEQKPDGRTVSGKRK